MKQRKIFKLLLSIIVLGLLLVLTTGLVAANYNQPRDDNTETRNFSIKQGETLHSVAARLEEDGIIRSAMLLRLISKFLGTDTDIKAGYYSLPPGATTIDIHNILLYGQDKQTKVTIPEGWTLKKIAFLLAERNIVSEEEFLAVSSSRALLDEYKIPAGNFEGYLFPDTYFFSEQMESEIVVRKMVDNFFDNLTENLPEAAVRTPAEIFRKVILASIIEREYRVPEEAVLIASVFNNRLRYRVGLESCATLEYIITDIQGKPHPQYITLEDKDLDSRYNTYKWHGLPPGPISNPGNIALHAAFYPADTDYWYFLLKDPEVGNHYFSKDLEEHIQAKHFYLKGYGRAP